VSAGVGLTWGIAGAKSWHRTRLTLDYGGSIYHYLHQTYFDGLNQRLGLGIQHQLSKRWTVGLQEGVSMSGRVTSIESFPTTQPIGPVGDVNSVVDYFDNRSYGLNSQADLTYQATARLSFNMGGQVYTQKRRSSALAGVVATGARGDLEYRLSRRFTTGVGYMFSHYGFNHQFGYSDRHSAVVNLSYAFGSRTEISVFGGAMRVESEFLGTEAVDPILRELLGISSAVVVQHFVNYMPDLGARFSKNTAHGTFDLQATRSINPGNGIFLTSYSTSVGGGWSYMYRKWGVGTRGMYSNSNSIGRFTGHYGSEAAQFSLSRRLSRTTHFSMGYSVRRFDSGDYKGYQRIAHQASVTIGYAPGNTSGFHFW
jgi:hypothetical protein